MKKQAMKVSERAVLARINRKMRNRDGWVMKKSRSDSRWGSTLGDYYVVDQANNALVYAHATLGSEAVDYGVLKPGEEVAN